ADRKELFDMIKQIKGNPKVCTVHGDAESCDMFAKEIHEQFGLETFSPAVNEEIIV
ncbi:MAG: MBL fold metallo-hydrolase RNA specificity domain-containing protein, partial [Nitrosopumilus sp.]